MNKAKINYFIDLGLAISFILCFFTGIIKWPGLIKVIGVNLYRTLHVKNISTIHDFSGLIMGILVFIHLILHLKWIKVMTKGFFKKKKKNNKLLLINKIRNN